MNWHWQNLNKERRRYLLHGRAWFGGKNTVTLEWVIGKFSFGFGFSWSDEDLTFNVAIPLILTLYISISTRCPLVKRLAPRVALTNYPDTIVIDERECSLAIHDWRLWLHPWSKRNEMVSADPWWVRGVSFELNPFRYQFISHMVRCIGEDQKHYWELHVGSWERDKAPDHRDVREYPYRYTLKSGVVQHRTATIHVERRTWRPRWFTWISLFERERVSIDVTFNGEVGERTGSWKGGTTGCGYDLRDDETPLQCLRRMEAERSF